MATIVGVSELALHLCTNREGLKRLEEAGVIQRLPDGKSYDQTFAENPTSSTCAPDRPHVR
jgi:hypothetical protein